MRGRHRYSDALVAMVCHDTNLGMQKAQEILALHDGTYDEDTVPTGQMADLHPDLRDAAVAGVTRARQLGASLSPRDHHNHWVEFLDQRGWQLGPKDPENKTHPNLKPWDDLDRFQQDKDRVFLSVVTAMTLQY